jgi:hypothetical protein
MPSFRSIISTITVALAIAFWVSRDVYSLPAVYPVPRIAPGENVVAIAPLSTSAVYGEDFSIRVLQADPGYVPPRWQFWAQPGGQQSVTIRVFRIGGFCREFVGLARGQIGVYPGLDQTVLSFIGIYRGLARFEVSNLPSVKDSALGIPKNQSAVVPGTDLTISVIDIIHPAPVQTETRAPDEPMIPQVTYSVTRHGHGGKDQGWHAEYSNQGVGRIARFADAFDIEVEDILPAQVHFQIRAVAKLSSQAQGIACSLEP